MQHKEREKTKPNMGYQLTITTPEWDLEVFIDWFFTFLNTQ